VTIFKERVEGNQQSKRIKEEAVELLLIIVVLFFLFGGGFYGYRRWR
jgi:hypothetical protein